MICQKCGAENRNTQIKVSLLTPSVITPQGTVPASSTIIARHDSLSVIPIAAPSIYLTYVSRLKRYKMELIGNSMTQWLLLQTTSVLVEQKQKSQKIIIEKQIGKCLSVMILFVKQSDHIFNFQNMINIFYIDYRSLVSYLGKKRE